MQVKTVVSLGVILLLASVSAFGNPGAAPETATLLDLSQVEEGRRFDFLLGEWSYRFAQGHGKTSYRAVADGTAILEVLESGFLGEREFAAASVLQFSPGERRWVHRWIDTLGNTLHGEVTLEPYEASELPALVERFEHGAQLFEQIYFDIREDRFETHLRISADGGETYRLVRDMPYLREGAAD